MRWPWDTVEGAILISVLVVIALTMFGIVGGSK